MVPKGWEIDRLADVCELINGRGFKPHEWDTEGYPIIRIQNLNGSDEFNHYNGEFNPKILVRDGELLFAWSGSRGTSFGPHIWRGPEAVLNYHTWRVVPKERTNRDFLVQYLRHITTEIEATAHGASALVHTQKDTMEKRRCVLPPLPEQRKIAEILSTWDAAIEKTEALLATAKAQKRALMQSLLTGKRRFPGFEGQEWKEVRLGDVITDVKRPLQWSDDALYRLISVRRRSGGLFHREDLYGRDIKTKTLKNAQAGDFLISKMQVVHGAMGLVTDEFDEMQISGSYISVVAKDPNQLRIEFFDWLSRMPEMYHRAYLCSYGVHIEKMTFSFDLFLKEKIVIPPSAAEQDRIVEALNCAQNEERELVDAITKLRTEKKALMQQLLTGKRRVEL